MISVVMLAGVGEGMANHRIRRMASPCRPATRGQSSTRQWRLAIEHKQESGCLGTRVQRRRLGRSPLRHSPCLPGGPASVAAMEHSVTGSDLAAKAEVGPG